MTYVIGDAAFVGDTLFMPDYGTARADFPGGNAHKLYRSARRVLALPDATRLFLCHHYKAPGRSEFRWETTVAAERAHNVHIHDGVSEDEFVRMRTARDAKPGQGAGIDRRGCGCRSARLRSNLCPCGGKFVANGAGAARLCRRLGAQPLRRPL
jgi:glyoxylase-like metal-dependent hydrolase (beta-lactamase superfamily II)